MFRYTYGDQSLNEASAPQVVFDAVAPLVGASWGSRPGGRGIRPKRDASLDTLLIIAETMVQDIRDPTSPTLGTHRCLSS